MPENTSQILGWGLVLALFLIQLFRNITFAMNFNIGMHTGNILWQSHLNFLKFVDFQLSESLELLYSWVTQSFFVWQLQMIPYLVNW